MPARSAGDDGDDRGDARPALRRADAARDRLERAAGRRGLARPALRPPAAAHARVRRPSCGWRSSAGGVEFHGETLELPLPDGPGKALKLTIAPVQDRIPIYLAAIGPRNTALAGEIADGWLPMFLSPEHLPELRALLEEGAARAGRSLDGFDIAPAVRVVVDDDVDAARDAMRPYIALYVGGMGSRERNFYNQLVGRYGFEDAAPRGAGPLPRRATRDEAMAAMPDELIDMVTLVGPPDRVRDRLRAYRDAGVGTVSVAPMAPDAGAGASSSCGWWRSSPDAVRLLLGAFGDPGHAFPMIALGRALAARGHDVTLQTWGRWEDDVVAGGMAFAAAPEDPVFPTPGHPMNPYDGGVAAHADDLPLVRGGAARRRRRRRPHPRAGARRRAVPACAVATLIPHVHPALGRGLPPVLVGARRPRTARRPRAVAGRRTAHGRAACCSGATSSTRRARALGLPAVGRLWGGISAGSCASSATFPQLEYPRRLAAGDRGRRAAAVGAAVRRRRRAAAGRRAARARRAVDVPGSRRTACCAAPWSGLADLPVRVLATTNRRPLREPSRFRRTRALVDWLSYARTMPRCDVVVCHGGHGTVARALASGCVVVVDPGRPAT